MDDDDTEQDSLENLSRHVSDDDDKVAKIVGIGINAGGNTAGRKLVVKG